ncbi:hypothetical protein R1flu_005645 [Riccia fluitans]|uniref:Uncharacterized protein n=1 Tax=Riccia fluitans TaxID=41844 RepID=A0ABD1YTR9_9MARC
MDRMLRCDLYAAFQRLGLYDLTNLYQSILETRHLVHDDLELEDASYELEDRLLVIGVRVICEAIFGHYPNGRPTTRPLPETEANRYISPPTCFVGCTSSLFLPPCTSPYRILTLVQITSPIPARLGFRFRFQYRPDRSSGRLS